MTREEAQAVCMAIKAHLSPESEGMLIIDRVDGDYCLPCIATGGHFYPLTAHDGEAPRILLGGEMVLPLTSMQDAWRVANDIAESCGYLTRKDAARNSVTVYLHEGAPLEATWDAQGFLGVREVA